MFIKNEPAEKKSKGVNETDSTILHLKGADMSPTGDCRCSDSSINEGFSYRGSKYVYLG